ncbi:predicted protein [Verticillium alfalfae VaMs.102]|uniref:Predicted protein n=1 Tax=Verticillium alfalfae (strain VaMs.102 / ATCC MYA-4576 / FGSC 10136) TaxID=526221 RepID=C9SMZ8_VERA1|nr:predicted protein [Verticillium alfalfae VaMs.102]EEY20163.1 predicted protein [Verticillium alfalfae VaMs.102]
MGGSAFASGENPLYTPRMPSHVYELVKSRCKSALRDLYIYVASPIDGPAKRDYGDVDVLMTCARGEFTGRSGIDVFPETVVKAIQHALEPSMCWPKEAARILPFPGRRTFLPTATQPSSPNATSRSTGAVHDAADVSGQDQAGGFTRFHVEAEYNRRLDEYIREKQTDAVWKDIKGAFPAADPTDKYACQYRGCTIKALKKVIIEGDTGFGVLPDEDSPMRDKDGFFILENVHDFISRKGEEVGRAAMARHHQAYEDLFETRGPKRKQETSSEVA